VNGFLSFPVGSTGCALRAYGVVQATAETLPILRKKPGSTGGAPTPANLLNHADDQTVVAVAAVLRAIDEFQLQRLPFADWGVVSSPRFAGRLTCAAALDKFHRLGPLSVSPVLIPFLSLHAVSSMISLALRIHGPAFGVGGGNEGYVQALLMGLALQQQENLPGVWVVMTGWHPEPVVECGAASVAKPVCQAVALALMPDVAAAHGPSLRLVPAAGCDAGGRGSPSLPDLVQFLSSASAVHESRTWSCPLPGDCRVELEVGNIGQEALWLARSA
jgi:hypothetical protein